MGLESLIQLIRQGEPVTPGVANRPLRELHQDVRYVWEVLQAASTGSTVYARRVTVEAEAQAGMAVYFNTARKRFERGLAALDTAPGQGLLQTADSARVWGVVAAKVNATLADVLLFGYAALDVSAATGGDTAAGTFYLSGTTPGRLVRQQPPVSVQVLRADGQGNVFVVPQFVDLLDRHTHYRFELLCRPAGEHAPPVPGERHALAAADAALPGWLPADHESFDGKAPPGAVFGYNLREHGDLRDAWPPLPASRAYLEWDRGRDKDVGFTGVPLGPGGLAVVDRNGIWWMSDCYGDVPWPTDYDSSTPVSYSDSAGAECPRHLRMAMTLWFSKVQFATENTVVRSLHSADDRVVVRCLGGGDGAAGDLEILLDLNLTVENDAAGYRALKEFDPDTGKFKRGPVVEGIYALSDNVTLVGSESAAVEVGGTERTVYKGLAGLSVAPADSRELNVQLIRLDAVEEQFFEDVTYLGFPAGAQTAMRCKIHVPADVELASPRLALRFRILGRAAGSLPQLAFTGRRLPRPSSGLTTPVSLPTSGDEFAITCTTAATLAGTNQYVEATSTPFAVAAGDVVLFTVERSDDDGYAGEVGILQQVGILTAGA